MDDGVRSFLRSNGAKGGKASGAARKEKRDRVARGEVTPEELAEYEARRERLREAGRKGGLAKKKAKPT